MTKLLRVLGKRGRITIPYEIRQKLGLSHNDLLSFTEGNDGRTVIVRRERMRNIFLAKPCSRAKMWNRILNEPRTCSGDLSHKATAIRHIRWARLCSTEMFFRKIFPKLCDC